MPMETRGWANMVPPAISATASIFNLVFILYYLLPRIKALDGPIAKLFKMLCFRPLVAQEDGGDAPQRWFSAGSAPAKLAAAGGFSNKDGVCRRRLRERGPISHAVRPSFLAL